MNVLQENISEGHASRHDSDDLSVGHTSQRDPLILNTSIPNVMTVLPETVFEGHASRHTPRRPRTKKGD